MRFLLPLSLALTTAFALSALWVTPESRIDQLSPELPSLPAAEANPYSFWEPKPASASSPASIAASLKTQTAGTSAPLSHADIVKQTTTASGHTVTAVQDGAKITCQMQTLDGDLTARGLNISSTAHAEAGSFAVRTAALGRESGMTAIGSGLVAVDGAVARLTHDTGLIEEVSTSSDGIRQDWVIPSRPAGMGSLHLDVALDGASVTGVAGDRVDLTVGGGRQLTWHQLMVTDAVGTTVAAHFSQVESGIVRLAIDDQAAVYPLRVDPTFTDADWVSMGGIAGMSGPVNAISAYGTGLVVAGGFKAAGSAVVNNVAYWNGSTWSALGAGTNGSVRALAVSGTDLYVGGGFSTAGGVAANNIAKWNGSTWSVLGTGTNDTVNALAVSGTDVYAGGYFTTAGDVPANYIAKWNGSAWSALGSGMNGYVWTFALPEPRHAARASASSMRSRISGLTGP